jgi:hypothetical protein
MQLDRKLNFQHHHQVLIAKAKMAQFRVKTITARYGLNPANARKVHTAAVQSLALYRAELRWNNHVGREHDRHRLIYVSARCMTEMF